MDRFLPLLLQGLAVRLPIYLFCIVGLLLAVTRWTQHPRVSLLAFLGIGLLFLGSLVAAVWYSAIPLLHEFELIPEQVNWIYGASAFALLLLDATALGLLLGAVFIDRQKPKGF
jgi:hypothetical protein